MRGGPKKTVVKGGCREGEEERGKEKGRARGEKDALRRANNEAQTKRRVLILIYIYIFIIF